MDEELLKDLKMRFDIDINSAIQYCESKICGEKYKNLQEFSDDLKQQQKCNICFQSWSRPTLVALCETCGTTKDSMICIPCFNKGHHEGHKFSFLVSQKGTCDCGDESSWKKEGFCSDHLVNSTKKTKIISPTQEKLIITIFAAAIHNFQLLAMYQPQEFVVVAGWLSLFSRIGDELRHCLALAFVKYFDIKSFLLQAPNFNMKVSEVAYNLFNSLDPDPMFRNHFATLSLDVFPQFVWMILKLGSVPNYDSSGTPLYQVRTILWLFSNAFSIQSLTYLHETKADWTIAISKPLQTILDFVSMDYNPLLIRKANIELIFKNMRSIISVFRKFEDQKERFASLISLFVHEIVKIEGALPISREFKEKIDDQKETHTALLLISWLLSMIGQKFVETNHYVPAAFEVFIDYLQDNLIDDFFDGEHEDGSLIFFRSIMQKHTNISISLNLHVLVSLMMSKQGENMKTFISELCDRRELSIEFFAIFSSLLPVRLIAATVQTQRHFVRNSSSSISSIESLRFKGNIKKRFAPLFALIQMSFGLTSDKEMFIAMLARTFGLFDTDLPNDIMSTMEFAFIHFIACLIYDRTCITQDFKRLKRTHILASLQKGPMQLSKISKDLWKDVLVDDEFMKDLFNYVTKFSNESGTSIKLKSGVKWHPFLPWLQYKSILDSITYHLSHNQDSTIPFPLYEPEPFGLSFKDAFSTSVLLAIEYHLLSNCIAKESMIETAHIVIGLIKAFGSESDKKPIDASTLNEIVAADLEELIERIPNTFMEFMFVPISYKGRKKETVASLIEQLGVFGENVLVEMNIGFIPRSHGDDHVKHDKRRAILAKQKVLDEFKKRISDFSSELAEETPTDICSVCSVSSGVLSYPVYTYKSVLPDVVMSELKGVKKKSYNHVTQIKLCNHLIHSKCILIEDTYQCPVCRGRRTCLLPRIEGFEPLSEEQGHEVFAFIFKAFGIDLKEIVHSFAGFISLSEIRFRLKPDFIDQPVFKALCKNSFLAIWHFFKFPEYKPESTHFIDPTEELTYKLIISEKPKEEFINIVKELSASASGVEKLEFIRRAALIDHFCLSSEFANMNGFYDWDELLQASSLEVKYQIAIKDYHLPVFMFMQLPKDFIKLQAHPYDINIMDHVHEIGVCLLTGQVVRFTPKGDESLPFYKNYVETVLGGTFTPFLMLTGRQATSVCIYVHSIKKMLKANDIYIDALGENDIGIRRGSPLSLSADRLLRLLESLLSGEWIDANADYFAPPHIVRNQQ